MGIKFGGLVVGVETAKLKSANIISHATHNDVMDAVALLAPPSPVLLYPTNMLPVIFLVNLRTHGFVQVRTSSERQQCTLINGPEAPPPNLKTTNISGYMVLLRMCVWDIYKCPGYIQSCHLQVDTSGC